MQEDAFRYGFFNPVLDLFLKNSVLDFFKIYTHPLCPHPHRHQMVTPCVINSLFIACIWSIQFVLLRAWSGCLIFKVLPNRKPLLILGWSPVIFIPKNCSILEICGGAHASWLKHAPYVQAKTGLLELDLKHLWQDQSMRAAIWIWKASSIDCSSLLLAEVDSTVRMFWERIKSELVQNLCGGLWFCWRVVLGYISAEMSIC